MVKYVIVLGDGMADRPLPELDGKTPLMVARKENMDRLARDGRCGMLKTLKQDMPFGSDIANMTVLGYDPRKYYTGGRGPLEAASMGLSLSGRDIALRCNLITEEDGRVLDHSAGHISPSEAEEIIESVKKELGSDGVEFYPGVGYRHLLVLRGKYSSKIKCAPPHDIIGEKTCDYMVSSGAEGKETAELLNSLIARSRGLLENHPVNRRRASEGKRPANLLWFWGAGTGVKMPSFMEKYGLSGALISAVDLLKGLAKCMGLEVVEVPGATGYLDTDYEGKAKAALEALENKDFVYVHVEAPDEAGHARDLKAKIKAIEDLDARLIAQILEGLEGKEYRIAVLPDHATPLEVGTHTDEPIPFLVYSSGGEGDGCDSYDEESVKAGSYGLVDGLDFMALLLGD